MIYQLLLFTVFDFAVYIFGAFVFFAAALLFFDSWLINKSKRIPLFRAIGFTSLSLAYVLVAAQIQAPHFNELATGIKVIGLIVLCICLIKEPILKVPQVTLNQISLPIILLLLSPTLTTLSSTILLCISFWYFRRSTTGLDRQLTAPAVAFFILALAEYCKLPFYWSTTTNVFWSEVLSRHSFLWNTQILLQLIGLFIFAVWIWGYIRFRLQIQLFTMIFALTTLIFFISTCFFTSVLLKNLELNIYDQLKTNTKVFEYALSNLQKQTISDAENIANRKNTINAVVQKDLTSLYSLGSEFLFEKNLSFLTIADNTGRVLIRGEDRESSGDSIQNDLLTQAALKGDSVSTFLIDERPIIPRLYIKSSVPIKDSVTNSTLGVIETGFIIDEAFVDGIKNATNLDVTIFAKTQRSATTLRAPDGKSRYAGTLESNKNIVKNVYTDGNTYIGTTNLFNIPLYTAYSPVKTFQGQTIGMISTDQPQTQLLVTVEKTIQITLLGSLVLMILSIFPTFLLSRYLTENIKA